MCCAHIEYEKPGAIKWEWCRGTSTEWDENAVSPRGCSARMLLSSKCLSWLELKRS